MKKIISLLIGIFLIGFVYSASCEQVYFFVLNSNYKWTNISLINNNISLNSIYDYSRLCQDSDYPELPKPSLSKLIVYENSPEECNYEDNFLKQYIPFFEIEMGKMNCSQLKTQSYFFDLEEKQTGFSAVGVNIFIVSLIMVLIIMGAFWIFKKEDGEN